MKFKENELINETLDKHFETWSHTLNTADFVPAKFLNKIDKQIYKKLTKKLKEVEIYNLLYLQEEGYKLGLFQKLKIYFSGLKPLYLNEKQEINLYEEIAYLNEELEKCKKSKRKKKTNNSSDENN